jgi:hypothetical protein
MMAGKQEYIVLVSHNTERGIGTNVCLVTDDFDKALRTCQNIEVLGYELASDEACASIHCFEAEKAYRRSDFSSHKTHPLIMTREKVEGDWKEIWVRKAFQR